MEAQDTSAKGQAMVYDGIIQNGVVVFQGAIALPDGTPVRIEPVVATPAPRSDADDLDPVFRMAELAGDAGAADLSINIDHYLYGHPKIANGQ
jgi:hypothetical protein